MRGKKVHLHVDLKLHRWWQWYGECTDTLGICNTNAEMQAKMSGGSLATALEQGEVCNFEIKAPAIEDGGQIPRNYYCEWSLDISIESVYYLSIKRDQYPVRETIELNILGATKQEQVTDIELASTDANNPWERYVLLETQTLQIFVRNKYNSAEPTF